MPKSPLSISELAAERAAKTSIPESEWLEILQRGLEGLRGQDVEAEGMEQIIRACKSPKQFALMVRLISQYCRSHGTGRQVFELIRKHRDLSVFSLSEWIESLEHLSDWLEQNHFSLDFLNMLNYLQCCTHLPDAKTPGAKLRDTLKESIKKYGVSWTVPKR